MYAFKPMIGAVLIAAALPAAVLPAAAQTTTAPAGSQDPDAPHATLPYDRGYDKDSPRTEAIDAAGRSGVADANNAANAASADQTASGGADQAQYAEDMAAYRGALRARHHAIASDQRLYDHQQRAYADAMADWRRQVYACHHGSNRACNAPTPDPAAYW